MYDIVKFHDFGGSSLVYNSIVKSYEIFEDPEFDSDACYLNSDYPIPPNFRGNALYRISERMLREEDPLL